MTKEGVSLSWELIEEFKDAARVAAIERRTKDLGILRLISDFRNPSLDLYDAPLPKFRLALQMIGCFWPGTEKFIAQSVTDVSRFPLEQVDSLPFAFGTDSRVYCGFSRGRKMVLKVQKFGGLGSIDQLLTKAAMMQAEYQKTRAVFSEVKDLVLPSNVVVINTSKSKSALAVIQPFLEGQVRDVFGDFTEEELKGELVKDNELRQSFLKFSEIFLRSFRSKPWECPDILGKHNLVLVQGESRSRMILSDPYDWYNENLLNERQDPLLGDELERRALFFERLLC